LIFINDLSDSLENPLYLFDDSNLCHTISHPSDQQAAASSLCADPDKSQADQTLGICLSIMIQISHPHHVSPKGPSGKTPIYFLNNPLEEVLSFKLLGVTICHDLSWEATFPSWPPKPVADWASSVVQSPSLAHLSF